MSSRKRHGGGDHDEEHENSERWLLTYADMITLLMALFIILYSMSVLNKSKFEAFQSSFNNDKLTGQPELAPPAAVPGEGDPTPTGPVEVNEASLSDLAAIKADIEQALDKAGLGGAASLELKPDGLSIDIIDTVLFDTGSADLLGDGRKVVDVVSPRVAAYSNPVVVEGHTDERPINTLRFPSNWELSTGRASMVVRAMVVDQVDPGRITAEGFGEFRPKVPNTDDSARAANRRVVITVVAPRPAPAVPAPPAEPTPGAAPADPAPGEHGDAPGHG